MVDPANRGWFKVPGLRPNGDRTLEEQMIGLDPALAEAKGKTVLDLGCAEGLISLAFAKAGASAVLGVEVLESHLAVARQVCKGAPQVRFVRAHLAGYIAGQGAIEQFDIVLALGIIHKLADPGVPLRFAARSAKTLLCFRGPGRAGLKTWDGVVRAKYSEIRCNVPQVLKAEGFSLEQAIDGVRGEGVQYWRRIQAAPGA